MKTQQDIDQIFQKSGIEDKSEKLSKTTEEALARKQAMAEMFGEGNPFNHSFDEVCRKGELENMGVDRSGYKLIIKRKTQK